MIDQTMNEEALMGAFDQLRGAITSYDDAVQFMRSKKITKDNSVRMIAWLVYLRLIPEQEEKRPSCLFKMSQNYEKQVEKILGENKNTPLLALDKKVGNVILADIDRSLDHFKCQAKSLKQPEYNTKYAHEHAIRILSILSLTGLSYLQGYDRYIFTCYLLALEFTSKCCLPLSLAEVLTFYILPIIIRMAEPSKFLDNIQLTQERYERFDCDVREKCPVIGKRLTDSGHGAIHYALRWEIVMFADEYEISSVFLWWDQFILNKDRLREFSYAACLAHVMQIKPPEDEAYPIVEVMQTFSKWDINKAIDDTYAIIEPSIKKKVHNYTAMVYFAIALLLLFVLYNFLYQ